MEPLIFGKVPYRSLRKRHLYMWILNLYKPIVFKGKNVISPSQLVLRRLMKAKALFSKLADTERNLKMHITYTIFNGLGTITRKQKIINLDAKPRKLERLLSGVLELRNQDFELLHLSGAWLKERHIKSTPLTRGQSVLAR